MPQNLLEPEPTRLPEDHPDMAARTALNDGVELREVAARYPAASYPWALLARASLAAGDPVGAYAFARTGYHRGLDSLRKAGWRGAGPIPADHVPNQGFLIAMQPSRSVRTRKRSGAALWRTTPTRPPATSDNHPPAPPSA